MVSTISIARQPHPRSPNPAATSTLAQPQSETRSQRVSRTIAVPVTPRSASASQSRSHPEDNNMFAMIPFLSSEPTEDGSPQPHVDDTSFCGRHKLEHPLLSPTKPASLMSMSACQSPVPTLTNASMTSPSSRRVNPYLQSPLKPLSQRRVPSDSTSITSDRSSSSLRDSAMADVLDNNIADMGHFRHYPHANSPRLDKQLWGRFVQSTKKRLHKAQVHQAFYANAASDETAEIGHGAIVGHAGSMDSHDYNATNTNISNSNRRTRTSISSTHGRRTSIGSSKHRSSRKQLEDTIHNVKYPPLPQSILQIPHNELSVGRLLGQGSFASVYEVKSLGKPCATVRWIRRMLPNGHKYDKESQKSKTSKQAKMLRKALEDGGHKHTDVVVKVLKHTMVNKPSLLAACAADMAKEAMLLNFLQQEAQAAPEVDSPYVSKDSNCHLVQFYAWSNCDLDGYRTGRHDAFFIVLERLEETLAQRLQVWKNLTGCQRSEISWLNAAFWRERVRVVEQIGQAVQHLHKHRIVHRDIKPDNIGFDSQNRVKVFDLDVCRILPAKPVAVSQMDDSSNNDQRRKHRRQKHQRQDQWQQQQMEEIDTRGHFFKLTKKVGSPRYMSPECAKGEPYNQQSDIYSMALVLHEVMTLQKPFEHVSSENHTKLVVHGGVRPELSTMWTSELATLIRAMWHEDPTQRPMIHHILCRLRAEYESH